VSPVGGLPEVVSGLSKDLILPGTDAQAIVDSIHAVLNGSFLLPNSQACRDHAQSSFDWSIAAASIRHIYQRALH
jgi:glycogen(starch) synthase